MTMWAIQIFLAVAFGAAGTMKLVRSKAQLAANPHMGWVHSVPDVQIKLMGVAELLGAIGLVAPMATGIAPFLTRVAAVCLATLMGGAAATHTMRGESAAVSTILTVLVIAVATFR
jgi:DoxX-like family